MRRSILYGKAKYAIMKALVDGGMKVEVWKLARVNESNQDDEKESVGNI